MILVAALIPPGCCGLARSSKPLGLHVLACLDAFLLGGVVGEAFAFGITPAEVETGALAGLGGHCARCQVLDTSLNIDWVLADVSAGGL
jgi:hypothetical protein